MTTRTEEFAINYKFGLMLFGIQNYQKIQHSTCMSSFAFTVITDRYINFLSKNKSLE
jgi:hypothetical protein